MRTISLLGEGHMSMRRRSAHSQETISAIHWSPLRRSKWNSRLNPAECALNGHLNAFARKGVPKSLHVGCDSFILPQFARFASLRLILQSFVCKEQLLPGSKDELLIAIYASK